jgi:hypothetical protein
MPSHGRECRGCDHWWRRVDGDGGDKTGECHEGPPGTAFIVIPAPTAFIVIPAPMALSPAKLEKRNFFPEVSDTDWCSRWKAVVFDDEDEG